MISISLFIYYYIIYFTILAAKTNFLFYHMECGIIFFAVVYILGN